MKLNLSILIVISLFITNPIAFGQSSVRNNSSSEFARGIRLFQQGQTTSGLSAITKAAEAGNTDAQAALGNIYFGDYWGILSDYDMKNPPVKSNKALADKWLTKAYGSISNSPRTSYQRDALSNLKRTKVFNKSESSRSGTDWMDIADFYSMGLYGQPVNKNKEAYCYKRAMLKGNTDAKKEYIDFCYDCAQDAVLENKPETAVYYCREILYMDKYSKEVKEIIGFLKKCGFESYSEGNKRLAYREFSSAGELGEAEALWQAGYMLYAGDGIPRNQALGINCIETSSKMGFYGATSWLNSNRNRYMNSSVSREYEAQKKIVNDKRERSDMSSLVVGGVILGGIAVLIDYFSSKTSKGSTSSYSSSSSSSSSSTSNIVSSSTTFYEGDKVSCYPYENGSGYWGYVTGPVNSSGKVRVMIKEVKLKGFFTFWLGPNEYTGWKQLGYVHGYDEYTGREYFGAGDIIEVSTWCLSKN